MEIEIVDKEAHPILHVSRKSASQPEQISAAMGDGFHKLMGFAAEHQIEIVGPPLSLYSTFNETETEFDVAFPISNAAVAKVESDGDVKTWQTPGGRALRALHMGPYDQLAKTYQDLYAHAAAEGLNVGIAWEYYLNDPGETAPEDLLTEVYIALT